MRVQVGPSVRAWRGDVITLITTLPPGSMFGRLFVFSKERGNPKFSPYVPELVTKMGVPSSEPTMFSMMMFRQMDQKRITTFVSDIDGKFALMQEIDIKTDPCVGVRWKRKVNPLLPMAGRLKRQVAAWLIPSFL